MRSILHAGLLVLCVLRLSHWRAEQQTALGFCSELLTSPHPLVWRGTLTQEALGRWELQEPRLVGVSRYSTYPRPLTLNLPLPEGLGQWGQQAEVRGRFRCQWPYQNEGALEDGLAQWHVPGVIAQNGARVRLLPSPGSHWFQAREKFRAWLIAPFAGPARGWVQAVWTGDLSALDPGLRNFYQESGLAQLLALSGQHVVCLLVLIEGFLGGVTRLTGRALPWICRRFLPLAVGSLLWFSSSHNPPIARTWLALVALLCLRRRGMRAHSAQVALTVGAFLLIVDPGQIARASFWLSVFSTYCLGEALLRGGGLRKYLWVSLWIPFLGFPATAFLFARVSWLAPLYTVLLGWIWELFVIPAGFLLPVLARGVPGFAAACDVGWGRFVAWHLRYAAMGGESSVSLRPTHWEWCLWEGVLLIVMHRIKRRVFDDASSIAI